MLAALVFFLRTLALICRGYRAVALENLALRQQLAVFKRHTSPAPPQRSAVLDPHGQRLAGLAHGLDRRAAGHRRGLASAMAPKSLETPLRAHTSGPPPQHECSHPDARQRDGRGESPVGSPSDPR